MKIARVGIVGAGTMGCGIAQLCAQSGFLVKIHDSVPDALSRVKSRIAEHLGHAVSRGKLSQAESDRALGAITVCPGLSELSDADLVIEAVSEDLRLKQKLFRDLGKLSEESVLATNTSSLPVWSLAQAANHPARVLGMHFFNPPVAMKLVEVVKTAHTHAPYFQAAWDFALALGRVPVEVKDTPGFIVNRVVRPYYLRGLRLANEGVRIDAVDAACRELGKVPLGPFELMDLIGVDVNLAITKVLFQALGSPERLRPSAIQDWLVNAGATGRKAGKGFYLYKGDGKERPVNPEVTAIVPEPVEMPAEKIWARVAAGVIEEAQKLFDEGVATKEAVDSAVKMAMNFPKGPFEWQSELKSPV